MLYIFPDTNIFVHGRHFEQIDWSKFTGSPEITLVIAPSVLSELDRHKYHSNKKTAQRIRQLLPRIEALHHDPAVGRWRLQVLLRRPAPALFDQHQLDSREQDDVLLATMLEFSAGLTTDDQCVLVTNDTGLRLKAPPLQLRVLSLSDADLLPPDPDESEKKIAGLQQELQQLKSRIPVVSLTFANGQTYLEIPYPLELISREDYVAARLEELEKEVPPVSAVKGPEPTGPPGHLVNSPLFSQLRNEQLQTYQQQWQTFMEKYAAYLETDYEALCLLQNCAQVALVIQNTGTVPADDLDILLHFPDGFELIEEDDLPELPIRPSLPSFPRHPLDFSRPAIDLPNLSRLEPLAEMSSVRVNVSSPRIQKTNSYDVAVHVRSVKHHQREPLDSVWLKYQDMRQAKGFTIDYQIIAANIPDKVTGQLHVKFVPKVTPT